MCILNELIFEIFVNKIFMHNYYQIPDCSIMLKTLNYFRTLQDYYKGKGYFLLQCKLKATDLFCGRVKFSHLLVYVFARATTN